MDPLSTSWAFPYPSLKASPPTPAELNAAWIRLGQPANSNAGFGSSPGAQATLLTLVSLLAGLTYPAGARNGAAGFSSGNPAASGPPAHFAFSSKPIPPGRVPGLVAQGALIGIDPNYEGSQATIDAVKRAGGRLHMYREGPGGATGSSGWGQEEFQRTRAAAARQGITINSPSDRDPGMRTWKAGAWRKHTMEQLKQDKAQGFESVEVDNIPEDQILDFYKEYTQEFRKGAMPKLMMKNLSAEHVRAVLAAGLPREMFADFAIWESSGGSGAEQQRLLAQLGIRQLTSTDTYNYSATSL